MNRLEQALNIVCKWRTLFAGWQLGTRPKGDPESDAILDHREVTILLRVETTAITNLLINKGLVTEQELHDAVLVEAEALNRAYEERFPGCTASEHGISFDLKRGPEIQQWMKNWKP